MYKKLGIILGIVLLSSTLAFGKTVTKKVEEIVLKTQKEKLSYSIGLDIAKSIKTQKIDIDTKLLFQGITDGLGDKKPLLTEDEVREVFNTMQREMQERYQKEQAELATTNQAKGVAFLADNKSKKDVVTLPSGLQYQELTPGTGATPKANDTVIVHYTGTFIDGKEFDSSYKRNEPAKFVASRVIPGWTEALQLMKVGAKWKLFIPSNLAYGENGAPPVIEPNSVLIFEVELVGIETPPTPSAAPEDTNK